MTSVTASWAFRLLSVTPDWTRRGSSQMSLDLATSPSYQTLGDRAAPQVPADGTVMVPESGPAAQHHPARAAFLSSADQAA